MDRTMRVLVVSHYALPHVGGVENLVDLEIRGLAAAGHEVALVTSNTGGVGRAPNYPASVRVVRVPAWNGPERLGIPYPIFSPRLFTTLWREVGRCDVVHAHGFMFVNSALAVLVSRLRGKPCILTDHGGIQKFNSRFATLLARIGAETVGRLSVTLATRAVTYNGRIQQTLAHLGRRDDVEFLPNPVDGDLFYPPTAEERQRARTALGWNDDRPRVLFAGRLIATKGIPLLLAAADPSYELVFCGPGDPAILGALPRPGIEYLPPRPQHELRQLYHAADALALPAEVREGFPLVVQEAVACGLPAVVGNDPGFAPYRDLPGLFFCERNATEIQTAIRRAIAHGVSLNDQRSSDRASCFPPLDEWVETLYPSTNARGEDRPTVRLHTRVPLAAR